MASRVSRTRLRLCLYFTLICVAAMGNATTASSEDRGPNTNLGWLGVIAGDEAGSEAVLATEMAELSSTDGALRVVPLPGDGGLNNISRLLDEPHIDLGFVSTDVLASAAAQGSNSGLAERLEVVARFCPQEVHVVARGDIASLADLAGKKVNFGPAEGSSATAAALLFRALDIEVEPTALDGRAGIEQLEHGVIAALVIVGAKPTPLIAEIPAGKGIHLLPIEFGQGLEDIYLPTGFDHDDYPNLVAQGRVPSIATGLVLLAAKSKDDPEHADRVTRFVDTLFSRFAELQRSDRHPKWREINLAASLPGWSRSAAAEAWLARHPSDAPTSPRAKIEAGAALPPALSVRPDRKPDQEETLFRQSIEWQRAKGH